MPLLGSVDPLRFNSVYLANIYSEKILHQKLSDLAEVEFNRLVDLFQYILDRAVSERVMFLK